MALVNLLLGPQGAYRLWVVTVFERLKTSRSSPLPSLIVKSMDETLTSETY